MYLLQYATHSYVINIGILFVTAFWLDTKDFWKSLKQFTKEIPVEKSFVPDFQ